VRVRISYGTDIKDVPQELEQLFLFVSKKSHNTSKHVRQIEEFLADEDVESALSLIEKLRLSLGEIDNRLNDISSIAAGFVNYKENEGAENAGEGRPSVDTAGDNPASEPPKQPTGNPHRAET
tara:strand:+ start:29 stop:397 length:369 start_codon:yes stop_codon:yes gene_type:complete